MVCSLQFQYNCDDNWKYLDQNVYVRYDPSKIESVRIYDKNDKYIATWKLDLGMLVDHITENKEDIATQEQKLRRNIKAVKELGKDPSCNRRKIDNPFSSLGRLLKGLSYTATKARSSHQKSFTQFCKSSDVIQSMSRAGAHMTTFGITISVRILLTKVRHLFKNTALLNYFGLYCYNFA